MTIQRFNMTPDQMRPESGTPEFFGLYPGMPGYDEFYTTAPLQLGRHGRAVVADQVEPLDDPSVDFGTPVPEA